MKVIAKKNRELALINAQNTQNENKAETITLTVPEEYEDYNKKIVFITDDGIVWDVITNNEYKITNAITKYKQVDFYIWLTKEVDGESIDFRTKTKTLNFYHNVDASDEITDEEIHGVNTVVNLLEEEIEKVENLNIEATKIGNTTTVTITKKDGTTKEVEINDGTDGQDGYTPQKGIDYFTEQDIEEIETDVKNDLEENVLVNYSLIAETGAKIELSINTTDYKLKAILKDKNNNIIHTSNVIDLPLETMVVNATYDNTTKKIILTLQNGTTVEFSIADLVSGLVSESQLQTILSNFYNKAEINNLLNNKVDKVQGKELSSNDFTDILKEKLEGLENYDDTEVKEDIEALQTENERLKATLPTTTGEGQDITLDKTAEFEFIKPPLPRGNSEQDGEPSPENEVPITNVTGDVEVVVENKNLFDGELELGSYNGNTGEKSSVNDAYRNANVIKVKPNTNYTFSINGISQKYVIMTYDKNKQFVEQKLLNNGQFTSDDNVYYINFRCYGSDFVSNFANLKVQLEKGSATDYIEHKSQTFTFPLGNEKLMLGDYLADDGIHHVRGQVVYNGTETWWENTNYTTEQMLVASAILTGMKTGTTNIISSIAKYANPTVINSIRAMGGIIGIGLDKTQFSTVSDFTTWLSTHNTTVEYELEQEAIVPYTSAQQEVYNQIKQAISYEEQTNISSNTIALFNVEAYQDAKVILAEKGTYSKPSGGIPKSDLASAVQTSLNKADTAIQSHQDISGKQDKTDNNLTTINKTIVGAINEVDSIAKGANQALSYGNYSTMITAFNNLANDIYNIGQNIMIITLEVPDLWISGIESTSSTYTYVDDETFVNSLATDGYVQVGYYKLSALETQKVNLDDYVTKTENKNKADIINNELTGSTIYFTDGINNSPVNKLIVNIEPVQEGSGTPTPNNVRNIIGWNAAIINYSGADTQNPNVLNVSWQNEAGIVYGGILNVTTGLLTVTKALVELAVADMNNTEAYPGWKNTGIESIIGIGINQKFTSILNVGDTFSANTTSGTGTIFLPRSAYGLTQEQWKEQYPNLTIQIIAEYQNPETYQLTPHEIRTLLGINNFWANTGDVTVNYKADTKLYIDSKFQSLEDRLSLLEG